tara:strand:- start:326 stop:1090 length:765 start_codon:yes stop_codon:yes gene_type:complete
MARTSTTTASFSLSSSDLLSSPLTISTSKQLLKAGSKLGLSQTTGLAIKTTTYASSGVIDTTVLFRGDDYAANGANKVYLKNLSTIASEYFTVYMTGHTADGAHDATNSTITGLTEIGRLYAGDFAFFPYSAEAGTKEAFTVTVANTWAAGDTFEFDGVKVVAANSTVANVATQIDNAQYPNWVTSVSTAVVTFVSRASRGDLEIDATEAVSTTAGDGTGAVATTVAGTKSISDIYIKPSVHTEMSLEHLLIHE